MKVKVTKDAQGARPTEGQECCLSFQNLNPKWLSTGGARTGAPPLFNPVFYKSLRFSLDFSYTLTII
jgi:hypothetical protein